MKTIKQTLNRSPMGLIGKAMMAAGRYVLTFFTWSYIGLSFVYADDLRINREQSDGKIGKFRQADSGDCFFLASLVALANDSEGKLLVNSVIHPSGKKGPWKVVFPNCDAMPMVVTHNELVGYSISNSRGLAQGQLVLGDPDVRILQIAADKVWKMQKVKPQGLWDDVPMNAFFMFTNKNQRLIWNRKKASSVAVEDVDKYKRLPKGIVKELQVSTYEEAHEELFSITAKDKDGVSMVLLDYMEYHGIAILNIDFEKMRYTYVDPLRGTGNLLTGDLKTLLERIASGKYAINYMELPKKVRVEQGKK